MGKQKARICAFLVALLGAGSMLWWEVYTPLQARTHSYQSYLEWPTGFPARVLETFSAPAEPWGAGRRGLRLEAKTGSPVYAARTGQVHWVGEVNSLPGVSVAHHNYRTTYQPVRAVVVRGQTVKRGQLLGYVAELDAAVSYPEDQLHFGVKIDAKRYRDPLPLLTKGPVRLLASTPPETDAKSARAPLVSERALSH